MTNFIDKKFHELIIPGCVVGGAYIAAQVGKDLGWRAVTYLAVAGAETTEIALLSLEEAGFINPLSKQTMIKARYIGNAVTWVFAIWKGPSLLSGTVRNSRVLFSNLPRVLTSPFEIKQYWHNHPNRILLTKQQTAALGATSIVAAALLAGPDRTASAVNQISATPGLVAEYVLDALNLNKGSWLSSTATPTWTKWAAAVPLAATGWWAVNKAASGVLWGFNKVFKGAQTPVHCSTYAEMYREARQELSDAQDAHWKKKFALEKDRDSWKNLANRLIDNLAPYVRDKLGELSQTILDAYKKESEDKKQ